jgi:positive regulator of sigma E activity
MHYLMNGTILRKKLIEDEMWVVIFSAKILSETFLILRKTKRDIIPYIHTHIFM